MDSHSLQGKPWVRRDQLKVGMTLYADSGFTCMHEGAKVLREDKEGFFVTCSVGHHYIDVQENEDGYLVGLATKA